MCSVKIGREDEARTIVDALVGLHRFSGTPQAFWRGYLEGAVQLCGGEWGRVMTRAVEAAPTSWQQRQVWVAEGVSLPDALPDPGLLERVISSRYLHTGQVMAVALDPGSDQPLAVLVIGFGASGPPPLALSEEPRELLLRLISDMPVLFQQGRLLQQAKRDVVRFAEVLDLSGRLYADRSFHQGALTLCNELAARFECSQVAFGLAVERGEVTLAAVSHIADFERRTQQVQSLEAAMEECLDQEMEVVWPLPDDRSEIALAHANHARMSAIKAVVSLPARHGGGQVGALICERDRPFQDFEIWNLRLFLDHSIRRLMELKAEERPFLVRVGDRISNVLAPVIGSRHMAAKLIALVGMVGLFWLLVADWDYRVEAPFLLRTDDTHALPAPFDGYILDVSVREGDVVRKGQSLATLDATELMLDRTSVLAEISRYAVEAEKARSEQSLASMKIARAMQAQAEARLERIAYNLEHTVVTAPVEGVVVEETLHEQIGAPVQKGEVLLTVASLAETYVEIDVDERDIHEIHAGMAGEAAFVGRPLDRFGIRVEQVIPVAEARSGRNLFTVRAAVDGNRYAWWRPGMSGVVKLEVGERPVIWVVSHRTVDVLRMLLWW
ncbi:MAG: efflux RND transporter periplasmic adaptor subunit [Magnetococcales bacterium]|nr:efflux RND transporter periplasmic adaptor subunit [Magnetococcales bacterium]